MGIEGHEIRTNNIIFPRLMYYGVNSRCVEMTQLHRSKNSKSACKLSETELQKELKHNFWSTVQPTGLARFRACFHYPPGRPGLEGSRHFPLQGRRTWISNWISRPPGEFRLVCRPGWPRRGPGSPI